MGRPTEKCNVKNVVLETYGRFLEALEGRTSTASSKVQVDIGLGKSFTDDLSARSLIREIGRAHV